MNIQKALRPESTELHTVIPLQTPFTFNILTNNYCDFRCRYCQQSLPYEQAREILGPKANLSFELFQKAVDGMKEFPQRFKVFNFCGTGETILTPDLPKMIAYANRMGVVDRTNVVTNANSLTHEKSDALIDAGLGSLRISIQGLDADQYRKTSDVTIDFDRFLEQIQYFYTHRNQCEVHIKIIDIALGDYTEQDFYKMFGDFCTSIAVERFVPNKDISSEKVDLQERDITVHGYQKEDVKVCFSSFYALLLNYDGVVTPCCNTHPPLYLGNVKDSTIFDMWHSQKLLNFWKVQLKDRSVIEACRNCDRPSNVVQPGDNIDAFAEEIYQRLTGGKENV